MFDAEGASLRSDNFRVGNISGRRIRGRRGQERFPRAVGQSIERPQAEPRTNENELWTQGLASMRRGVRTSAVRIRVERGMR
jgi:ribosomal protein L19E